MDDVKDKMKDLMKKVNNPFSSSKSGKFKGPGRVLGSSSSSSSSSSSPTPSYGSKNLPVRVSERKLDDKMPERKVDDEMPEPKVNLDRHEKSDNGFDPFDTLITSGKRNPHGSSLKVFECPVCSQPFGSEEEVDAHIESCLSSAGSVDESGVKESEGSDDPLQIVVSTFVSGKPTDNSKEVILRLLRNVVKEPENAKFRKIRMGNPKIKEAIGDVPGGVELLESVGFKLIEESDELWLFMEVPSEEQIGLVKNVILLLEPKQTKESPSTASTNKPRQTEELSSISAAKEPVKIDRQVRVFFSVPESVAAKIELPDSFYNLTAEEVKREAETRRKKMEESKLLIPKSYREKQAKAARKQYAKTVIRIQFPDGVVLQAMFSPLERTNALYEFVSSALKEPTLSFELLDPVLVKRRVIPRSPGVTLEDEKLVPAALVKFRPIETDTIVFTGLCNELLEISEPLVSQSAVPFS